MEETSVLVLRRLKASPRAVWRALNAPHERLQWLDAENEYDVTSAEADESDAARYHVVMQARGGEPPVTLELTRAGDRTDLLLRQDGFPDRTARNRAERAWKSRIRRLAQYVETR